MPHYRLLRSCWLGGMAIVISSKEVFESRGIVSAYSVGVEGWVVLKGTSNVICMCGEKIGSKIKMSDKRKWWHDRSCFCGVKEKIRHYRLKFDEVEVDDKGKIVSWNFITFCPIKYPTKI